MWRGAAARSDAGKAGFIEDSDKLATHREALGYTVDCIVLMLKRQGLDKDDEISPEEVTQVGPPPSEVALRGR